jgi:pimeloyl-ACP methyl ester carboxylesterase
MPHVTHLSEVRSHRIRCEFGNFFVGPEGIWRSSASTQPARRCINWHVRGSNIMQSLHSCGRRGSGGAHEIPEFPLPKAGVQERLLRPCLPRFPLFAGMKGNALISPVLLLSGDRSRIASDQQKILAESLQRGRLELFAGCGHGVNLLQPERCARTALDFWRAVETEKQAT